jgi:hypothetical protein
LRFSQILRPVDLGLVGLPILRLGRCPSDLCFHWIPSRNALVQSSFDKLLKLFQPFKKFNRYAPFNPPPLSSPASRGRIKEGAGTT